MIREAYFRLRKLAVLGISMMFLVLPVSVANAGGWWNHRSVVAVPTGPSVGTVTGAAPYQIFTGPAVASAPAVTFHQGYSYAPAAVYSAPVQAYSYGLMMPVGMTAPAGAPVTNAFAANGYTATGNSQNDDLVRELANRLRTTVPSAAAGTAQSAASASTLSDAQLLQELGRRNLAPSAAAATNQQPAYGYAATQPQQAYTPVLVGYSYAVPAPAHAAPQMQAAQTVTQQPGMSLVPVQLYKQKSFLGHEKLKPVSVYPYGVR